MSAMTIHTPPALRTVMPPERLPLLEWQRIYKVGTRCDQTDTRWQDFDLQRRVKLKPSSPTNK